MADTAEAPPAEDTAPEAAAPKGGSKEDAPADATSAEAPVIPKRKKKTLEDYVNEGWTTIDHVRRPPTRPPPKTPNKMLESEREKRSVFSRVTSTRTWYTEEDDPDSPAPEAEEEAYDIPLADTALVKTYDVAEERKMGNFSIVTTATNKEDGKTYTIKLKDLVTASGVTAEDMKKEQALLASLEHKGVVALKETIPLKDGAIAQVFQPVAGSEMLPALAAAAKYTEADARLLASQMIEAVAYLHAKKIVHLMLTCEYIHIDKELKQVVISNFSVAQQLGEKVEGLPLDALFPESRAPIPRGFINFQGPEIVGRTNYGLSTDLWSVGVLIYVLLSGNMPFKDSNRMKLQTSIGKAEFSFPEDDWKPVSDSAKDLIAKLIVADPAKRLSIADAQAHPWFKETTATELPNVAKNAAITLKDI